MGGFECAYLWGVEMKYEITKGSAKDFEDAPESATVRIIESGFEDRFPIFADKFENCSTRTHCATGVYGSFIADVSNWSIIAERRPITEPAVNQQLTTEWDGEYPIPAGVNVEVHFDGDDSRVWTEFRVEYMRGDVVVLYDYRSYCVESWPNARLSFRPIRSPDEVARDEAIKAMREALGHAAGLIEVSNIYRAIAAGKIPGVKLE